MAFLPTMERVNEKHVHTAMELFFVKSSLSKATRQKQVFFSKTKAQIEQSCPKILDEIRKTSHSIFWSRRNFIISSIHP
jgi:hypothetical protein